MCVGIFVNFASFCWIDLFNQTSTVVWTSARFSYKYSCVNVSKLSDFPFLVQAAFDSGVQDLREFDSDIHAVAGALKLYLRELPDPVMTCDLYQEWMQAANLWVPSCQFISLTILMCLVLQFWVQWLRKISRQFHTCVENNFSISCVKVYILQSPFHWSLFFTQQCDWKCSVLCRPAEQRLQALWMVLDKLPKPNYINLRSEH